MLSKLLFLQAEAVLILQKDLIGVIEVAPIREKSIGTHAELRGEWAARGKDKEFIAIDGGRRKLRGRRWWPGPGVILVVF